VTSPVIALVGTLDTKGDEYAYLRDRIREAGASALLIDAGVLGRPGVTPDITRQAVAAAAGRGIADLAAAGDRAVALGVMGRGTGAILADLVESGSCSGVLAVGGSGGTSVAVRAFSRLPFGFPKMIVSTQVASAGRALAGGSDVLLMSSVADIAGLNRLTRRVLSNAAAAIVGAVRAPPVPGGDRRLAFATMLGLTTTGVTAAGARLQEAGYEVVTFHATGEGGRAMEKLIGPMGVSAMLDLTTVEIADEVVGGTKPAGGDRLRTAGRLGVPQVVSTGGTDMVRFGPRDSVPERFGDRLFHVHNDLVTLMRTSPEECLEIGRVIGARLASAKGPAVLMIPLRGSSAIAVDGGPFHDPAADSALAEGLRESLTGSDAEIVRVDTHINDPAFSQAASATLLAISEGSDRALQQ